MAKETSNYSIEKKTEGGTWLQREALAIARAFGATAKRGYSPYVGYYGISVTATKTQHKKISDALFSHKFPKNFDWSKIY